ncbi:MAG: acyl-CoA thioesterase [Polyangiaceae bacterium]
MDYSIELTASPDDIDELGHVSNIVYVRWIQDIATAHSASLGLGLSVYREEGGVFVVRRHEIDYLQPVLEGQLIRLTTWVPSWKGASCERHTRIVRVSDGAEIAKAVTRWAFVGVADGRPRRIPQRILDPFQTTQAT